MVLTGLEILNQINIGNIEISDFDEKRLNPNSYNLRLHDELKIYDIDFHQELDMKRKDHPLKSFVIPDSGFILLPGIVYLGRTFETTRTIGFVPQIQGRSSIGRLGIDVHKTAGWGDNGFSNYWTLEIVATQPVKIYPFVEFCQIIYMSMQGDPSMVYNGKYQNTGQIDSSKIYEEFNR